MCVKDNFKKVFKPMRENESRWDSMVQTIDEETQLETKTWRC